MWVEVKALEGEDLYEIREYEGRWDISHRIEVRRVTVDRNGNAVYWTNQLMSTRLGRVLRIGVTVFFTQEEAERVCRERNRR